MCKKYIHEMYRKKGGGTRDPARLRDVAAAFVYGGAPPLTSSAPIVRREACVLLAEVTLSAVDGLRWA